MFLLERCLLTCRLLPDISSLGLDNMEGAPLQNFTTSTKNNQIDSPTSQGRSRYKGAVKRTSMRGKASGKLTSNIDQSPLQVVASKSNVLSVELPQSATKNIPTMERDNPSPPPPLSIQTLLEEGKVKVRGSYTVWGGFTHRWLATNYCR